MPYRVAMCLCLGLVLPVATAADGDLVGRVRDEHRAARESIRTLSATVTFERVYPTQGVSARAKYWRSGDVVRIQEGEEGAGTEDYLLKDGEIRQVGRAWAKGGLKVSAVRRAASSPFAFCDAWREMMIEMNGPGLTRLSLDRFLEDADGPISADRVTLDGRPCVRLRFSQIHPMGVKYNITQWFDIGHNYLIRKAVAENPASPPSRSVAEVTDFIEPEPGVVLPVRVKSDHYTDGELKQTRVVTLTDVVVNRPVKATAFALPAIPSGTELRDSITMRMGRVDSNWNWIGATKELPPPLIKLGSADPANPDAAPSTSEPPSTARLVLLVSATVIIIAAVVTVFACLRRRREQPAD